jgi:tRNA (cmo5U34)-methyltransferase
MTQKQDRVYKAPLRSVKAFKFDKKVAMVFDDMVSRSVPIYHEVHGLLADLLKHQFLAEKNILDLGCSTGSTMVVIDKTLKKYRKTRGKITGIDNSKPMLELCQKKCSQYNLENYELIQANLEAVKFPKNVGLVVMNYTLQFIPKGKRAALLKKIYKSLDEGGVFVLAEKICTKDPDIEKLQTRLYYDFKKRRGYSDLEISQKRDALENVLIPLTPSDQIIELQKAGFIKSEMLFRWYNFAVYVGIK